MSARPFTLRLRGVLLLALAGLAAGCQTADYYTQALRGQSEIWRRQRSIEVLLAATNTPAALKDRLRLVLDIRAFAETNLHLPANGHYLRYADLGRPFAVWNVYAAPEFSLTPKSWWYPVVGRLDYRGYFSEEKARRYAARLEAKGFDVYVGGVTAYSTLGWFRDPVLNTFVHDEEMDLAELLFHELAHQKLFVAGDTDFNEAFATAVAEEGLRRWMQARRDPAAREKHQAQVRRTGEFVELVTAARHKLALLYGEAPGSTNSTTMNLAARRLEKQRVIEELRLGYAKLGAAWGGRREYDEWFRRSLNNAQLNTVDTYYNLVPAFRRLLRDSRGDLEIFYAAAGALKKLKKFERHARLAALAPMSQKTAGPEPETSARLTPPPGAFAGARPRPASPP